MSGRCVSEETALANRRSYPWRESYAGSFASGTSSGAHGAAMGSGGRPVLLSIDHCATLRPTPGAARRLQWHGRSLPASGRVHPRRPRALALQTHPRAPRVTRLPLDRKSTRLNSSHLGISYAVFCLKKKKNTQTKRRGWKRPGDSLQRDDDRDASSDDVHAQEGRFHVEAAASGAWDREAVDVYRRGT